MENRQRGLTLLELLIALSIFALMGAVAYRLLAGVIEGQRQANIQADELAALQKTLTTLDQDINAWLDRPVSLNGELQSSLILHEDYPILLTRSGWRNPLQLPRSQLQRVAYDIGQHPSKDEPGSRYYQDQSNYLRRLSWPVLDQIQNLEPRVQVLLAGVDAIDVWVISRRNKLVRRHHEWPLLQQNSTDNPLTAADVAAIELHLQHRTLGELTRLYKVN